MKGCLMYGLDQLWVTYFILEIILLFSKDNWKESLYDLGILKDCFTVYLLNLFPSFDSPLSQQLGPCLREHSQVLCKVTDFSFRSSSSLLFILVFLWFLLNETLFSLLDLGSY